MASSNDLIGFFLYNLVVAYFFGPPSIFSWILSVACCLVVWLSLGFGLDLAYRVLVFMHIYLYKFLLSLHGTGPIYIPCSTPALIK